MAPSTDEQLCAAAFRILSDGRRHAREAVLWAMQQLNYDPVLSETASLSEVEQDIAERFGFNRKNVLVDFCAWMNERAESRDEAMA